MCHPAAGVTHVDGSVSRSGAADRSAADDPHADLVSLKPRGSSRARGGCCASFGTSWIQVQSSTDER